MKYLLFCFILLSGLAFGQKVPITLYYKSVAPVNDSNVTKIREKYNISIDYSRSDVKNYKAYRQLDSLYGKQWKNEWMTELKKSVNGRKLIAENSERQSSRSSIHRSKVVYYEFGLMKKLRSKRYSLGGYGNRVTIVKQRTEISADGKKIIRKTNSKIVNRGKWRLKRKAKNKSDQLF